MADRKKTKSSLLLFVVLFLWLVLIGQSVMGWASPMSPRCGTKPKKLVDKRYEGISFEDTNIKVEDDYGGDENNFANFYRQHEDIPSPGVGH
ncbi:hypothetical protein FXO38_21729 [Capsicum annuum]|uniref:Transmembrane protein n=1 Tax=Capsicum annuum TaxID=4072 RepID=A0A2G2ZJH9_CAPAN|nr:hypothetical protein FXO37_28456 [Capsicum annuum]KAF3641232.1 hypothetical protein FXO38_21729 [Capsicum annuum]PHT82084.1 hypothetical protein T459_15099 [Capsicum annuum]